MFSKKDLEVSGQNISLSEVRRQFVEDVEKIHEFSLYLPLFRF